MSRTHGLIADTVVYTGHRGDEIVGYEARPLGNEPSPGIVVIHHNPGWDEESHEIARKFAHHGYHCICPNLYSRYGHTTDPADAAAMARQAGGLPDAQVTGDVDSTVRKLLSDTVSNGKVGAIGFCSGGRYAFLAACQIQVDAVVDCYGGSVVVDADKLNELRPVAPIDLAARMSCPVLGIFGADDPHVPPEHIATTRDSLLRAGKDVTIYSYPGAAHAFLSPYKPSYRVDAATDAWRRIFDFFGAHLSVEATQSEVDR